MAYKRAASGPTRLLFSTLPTAYCIPIELGTRPKGSFSYQASSPTSVCNNQILKPSRCCLVLCVLQQFHKNMAHRIRNLNFQSLSHLCAHSIVHLLIVLLCPQSLILTPASDQTGVTASSSFIPTFKSRHPSSEEFAAATADRQRSPFLSVQWSRSPTQEAQREARFPRMEILA